MIKKVINKLSFLIEYQQKKKLTKRTLEELRKSNDDSIRKMGSIINFIISDYGWKNEEKSQFNEIDKLEKKYLNSSITIENLDFGAGKSNSSDTKQNTDNEVKSVLKISDIHRIASSKKVWGKLIFKIIREFKPTNCLELGTSLGISASYQILALKLNGCGDFTTIEGSQERAKIANKSLKDWNYKNFQVLNGRFSEILPNILDKNKLIDFAFIDGHHDENATQEYFELLYPFLTNKSILIFDDINWSEGMKSAWQNISNDSKIHTSFDLYQWGICLINKEEKVMNKNYFDLRL